MSALKSTAQTYLNKFSTTTKLIKEGIVDCTKMIIVIPSCQEEGLANVLHSLAGCDQPRLPYEIIVILNSAEDDPETQHFHSDQLCELRQRSTAFVPLHLHLVLSDGLPPKHAGVGLARKIGMDEAVRRFAEINYDGMIVCLDADCTVSKNYLIELEKIAVYPQQYNSVGIHFEHPYEAESDPRLKEGIVLYELYLRYYKESLKYCGFPYAYHTIGSSMAVKTSVYCRAGGMNRRKAGEDFYFLHKVFPYGKVVELNSCAVYPSCRVSRRVPFGTGRAQLDFLSGARSAGETYSFKTFEMIEPFFKGDLCSVAQLGAPLQQFLKENGHGKKVAEIRENTNSEEQFRKRFFAWFDGFMMLRYVHYMRDNHFSNEKLTFAIADLLKVRGRVMKTSLLECLEILRVEQGV